MGAFFATKARNCLRAKFAAGLVRSYREGSSSNFVPQRNFKTIYTSEKQKYKSILQDGKPLLVSRLTVIHPPSSLLIVNC
jgi:hypothetical protein